MISYIKGVIIKKLPTSVIIENNGLGYEVFLNINNPTIYENNEIELYTYLHVREDAWTLYGFLSWEEREVFLLLISVSGIGPKIAMAIISYSSLSQLKRSIATGNIDGLIKIPGIGKKTAQRIVVELKDKMADLILPSEKVEGETDNGTPVADNSLVFEGLKALGYQPMEIKRVLPLVLKENSGADDSTLIKKALQLLAKI